MPFFFKTRSKFSVAEGTGRRMFKRKILKYYAMGFRKWRLQWYTVYASQASFPPENDTVRLIFGAI